MINKQCLKCNKIKPISEYYRDKTKKDGYKNHCKACDKLYQSTKRKKYMASTIGTKICGLCGVEKQVSEFNKYKSLSDGRSWWCKDCAHKNWKKKMYKSKYGISYDDYLNIYKRQNGKCAICGMTEKDNGKDLALDHCHNTGIVRGLLCWSCNLMLGYAKDNAYILNNAILYLKDVENYIVPSNI